jgi:hypothetical protein
MISYCIASYRPTYSRMLIEDLIRKTSAPFEILVWLNVEDPAYEQFLHALIERGTSLRIVGKTPENIGMRAYPLLFSQARYDIIVQIDDDVVAVSRRIAELAAEIFQKFPRVKQLVADVWQDEYTTGARPPMSVYKPYQSQYGLYEGPIDGWFSMFHRSVLPLALGIKGEYLPLGGLLRNRLRAQGKYGLLCTRFKVFHVIGPEYASYFDTLEFEIEKYRRLGRHEIVDWYTKRKSEIPSRAELEARTNNIYTQLDSWEGHTGSSVL